MNKKTTSNIDYLPNSVHSFIWHFLQSYKLVVVIFVFLTILAGFWGPFNNLLIKHIINSLSQSSATDIHIIIWPAVLIVVNFIVFDNITWRSVGFINYKFQPIIKNKIISETLNFVLGESYQFFQDNLSGKISSQINMLADSIELILYNISADFIRGTSLLIISFAMSFYVNPLFFFVLLIWFIAFATFSYFMSKHLVILADKYAGTESIISGQIVDSVTNSSNIRLFARKKYEISRLHKFLLTRKRAFQEKELFMILLSCGQGLMIAIMMCFTVWFLLKLYQKDLVTIGDFALILGLSMELGHMMWHTMSRFDEFNQAIGKCKQCLRSLIIVPEIQDKNDAKNLIGLNGEIIFDEVKFHYKDTEPLFQNKSITIHSGQKVGLVGYSGSGKSTFVNLILRLYDVVDGRILIDQQDIRDVTQDSLHENISIIPQDPLLFHRSLMENIRYGNIDATDEEVFNAAKKAKAHEFIKNLPQGYESLVGERGIKLSGGQRQRIAIARAILKNSFILILDEATSQLDSITENEIQNSLYEILNEKTTIVIAHRLSTLLHMDRILVFDKGMIVEDGTHIELLNNNGLYKILWDTQVGGFLPDVKII